MDFFSNLLQRNPELAVFLAIGIGYWVGAFKIRGVGFGPVTGSLLAGLLIGYFVQVPISDTAKQVLFLLFMFGIGYSVGPSFFRGMKDGGWRWAVLGLLVGWRNAGKPLFGRISHASLEFMKSIGLAGFVAMIGLKAGPLFVDALKEVGLTIFLAGIVVTLVPLFVGLLVGRYLSKLEPLLLLGALAGVQTMTAGLAAVQEKSDSPVAVIGYSGTVAFGHILITTWGTVIVWLLF